MKKATRIALIVSAVLIALGLVIGGVGFALGGGRGGSQEAFEKTHEISGEFSSINIDCISAPVRFFPSEDGSCRAETCESEDVYFEIEVKNGALDIRQIHKRKFNISIFGIGLVSPKYYLKLYLPAGEYDKLAVTSVSGAIEAPSGFTFRDAVLTSVSGSIKLDSAVRNSAELTSTSGSVSAGGFECERITVKSVSGKVSLSSISCGEAEVKCTSGRIELSRVVASSSLTAKNTSGSIVFDNCDGREVQAKTVSGSITGSLLTPKEFSASSVSGKVNVPRDGEGGSCELRTTSGKIDITIAE